MRRAKVWARPDSGLDANGPTGADRLAGNGDLPGKRRPSELAVPSAFARVDRSQILFVLRTLVTVIHPDDPLALDHLVK
jgi:hypothetical protein